MWSYHHIRVECRNIALMSVFKLSEISGWLMKDEKTLRRWCIAGRVKGAFQTKGGHWRVRARTSKEAPMWVASDIQEALESSPSAGAKRKFHRRNRDATQKKLGVQIKKLKQFHARGRGWALMEAARAIIARVDQMEISKDEREKVVERLNALVWEQEVSPQLWDLIQRVAAGIWAKDASSKGRRGLKGAAAEAGMARNTFRHHFLNYLPNRTDAEPEPEPCDFHEHSTEDERRAYAGAAQIYAERWKS